MKSAFSTIHPAVAFLYYAGLLALAMTLLHPIFLATGIVILIALNIVHEIKMKGTLISMFGLALIIAISNPFLTHRGRTMLFYFRDNPITLEAITYGYTMALSFILIACIFLSYNALISSHKFLYLFSRISPKVALLTMITMRFIPLFIRRLKQIQLVQKTRKVHLHKGSAKNKIESGMKLLSVLLVCSLEEALQTADSMAARGFGTSKRSTSIRYHIEPRDWFLTGILLVSGIACLFLATKGAGILPIYPKVHPLLLQRLDWVSYGFFICYVSTPLWLEGREWVWWYTQK